MTHPHQSPSDSHGRNQPHRRKTVDLTLYLVTHAVAADGHLQWPAIVDAAIQGGVSVVQLRHKTLPDDEFVAIGQTLHEVTTSHNIPLLVNDRVHLVAKIGAAGAHIGQTDITATQARHLLGPEAILGLTVKTPAQAVDADPQVVDYVGAGPVFSQSTKPDAGSAIGLSGLQERLAASRVPVVAIGGINCQNAASVYAQGVAGVATASSICQAQNPRNTAHAIVSQHNTTTRQTSPADSSNHPSPR